jgi:hypothetical protein
METLRRMKNEIPKTIAPDGGLFDTERDRGGMWADADAGGDQGDSGGAGRNGR